MRRVLALSCALLLSAGSAEGQSQAARYTSQMDVTTTGTGQLTEYMKVNDGRTTTVTEVLRGRMRLETIEGPGSAKLGEYQLIDSTDLLTVNPNSRTFTRLNLRAVMDGTGGAMVASRHIDSIAVTLDSVAGIDSVSGVLAMRYRVRTYMAVTSTVDASQLPAGISLPEMRVQLTSTYEYWFAAAGPDDPMPVTRPGAGATKSELATKMAEAFQRLPHRRMLRSTVTTRNESEAGVSETHAASAMIKRDSVMVDDARFTLPPGYTERVRSGAPADSTFLARWRKPPE